MRPKWIILLSLSLGPKRLASKARSTSTGKQLNLLLVCRIQRSCCIVMVISPLCDEKRDKELWCHVRLNARLNIDRFRWDQQKTVSVLTKIERITLKRVSPRRRKNSCVVFFSPSFHHDGRKSKFIKPLSTLIKGYFYWKGQKKRVWRLSEEENCDHGAKEISNQFCCNQDFSLGSSVSVFF